ncbi:MAG: PAS domain-containing protein [Acidobacteria bacterium]|nr:MAG: PAS domain-containing protein [Acidobacteriota bacterium]
MTGGTAVRAAAAVDDAYFRRLVEGMRCGLLTVDRGGRILTINALARQILDLDDEDPIEGMPVRQALARHPRLAEVLLDALEMSHLPNRAELEIRSREDDGKTIGFTISPIPGDDGEAAGIGLFFKDLTHVERLEEQEKLRDRLAALGQMGASLAHEIRNPLASIEVTVGLLRRRLRDRPEELRLVEKIVSDVARVNRIVSEGLEFARPVAPEWAPHEVSSLLERAVEEASARFGPHRVEVERDYEPALPPVIVDGGLIRQMLVNIVLNAFEAMEGRGRLRLEVRGLARPGQDPAAVEIRIADDGPGIQDEVREKIFYPFVTSKRNGSGLGLPMARKIAECHHGMIDVMDGPEGGTVFRIRLPRTPDGRKTAG